MHVLLVVPYFGGSHRAWAEGYARHSRHDVRLLTLPARFWKWRMHGGAVTLAGKLRARLDAGMPLPDVLLATDMVNVPAFLALTRERLASVPVVLYCHENQLTYPLREGERRDFAYPMINWLSMLTADCVAFNSEFHRRSWFGALPNFLKHFPDYSHLELIPKVRRKSLVLPVGVGLAGLDDARSVPNAGIGATPQEGASKAGALRKGDTEVGAAKGRSAEAPLILWNQRWEYDKNPAAFFEALRRLVAQDVPFRVALAGANYRQVPAEFEDAHEWLGDRLVQYGRADRPTYHRLLWDADIVVSTAIHEFFGIATVEAIYCRTFPVLPNRLAYPELVPRKWHARCLYDGPEALLARLIWALDHAYQADEITSYLRSSVARFDWHRTAPVYDAVLEDMMRN